MINLAKQKYVRQQNMCVRKRLCSIHRFAFNDGVLFGKSCNICFYKL